MNPDENEDVRVIVEQNIAFPVHYEERPRNYRVDTSQKTVDKKLEKLAKLHLLQKGWEINMHLLSDRH